MLSLLALASWSAPARADNVDDCAGAAERAQAHKLAGKLRAARVELAKCVQSSCPFLIRKDCKVWEKYVEKDMASIVVRVEDPGGQPAPDATLELDGEAVVAEGGVLDVDPGEHTLRAERPPFSPGKEHVVVGRGERQHEVVVHLQPAPPPLATAQPKRAGIPTATWIVGGAGVAAIGVGIGLWLGGLGQRDDLRASCGPRCTESRIESAKWTLRGGDIVFSAGAVALGTAVFLAIFLRGQPSSPEHVAVRPLVGPGSTGLSLVGQF